MTSVSAEDLCVVLDVNPVWWAALDQRRRDDVEPPPLGFTVPLEASMLLGFVKSVATFACAHLMLHNQNAVTIIACLPGANKVIYTSSESNEASGTTSKAILAPPNAQYEVFSVLTKTVKSCVVDLVTSFKPPAPGSPGVHSPIAGAVGLALCKFNRLAAETSGAGGGELDPVKRRKHERIVVVHASNEDPRSFLNLTNCAFTAQKRSVTIDVCSLNSNSGRLQQMCELTDGTFFRISVAERGGGLLGVAQVLNTVFLADVSFRRNLCMPDTTEIDSRAACFCHHKLIKIGFVCSVCLAVFCEFNPICPMCKKSLMPKLGGAKTGARNTSRPGSSLALSRPGTPTATTQASGKAPLLPNQHLPAPKSLSASHVQAHTPSMTQAHYANIHVSNSTHSAANIPEVTAAPVLLSDVPCSSKALSVPIISRSPAASVARVTAIPPLSVGDIPSQDRIIIPNAACIPVQNPERPQLNGVSVPSGFTGVSVGNPANTRHSQASGVPPAVAVSHRSESFLPVVKASSGGDQQLLKVSDAPPRRDAPGMRDSWSTLSTAQAMIGGGRKRTRRTGASSTESLEKRHKYTDPGPPS